MDSGWQSPKNRHNAGSALHVLSHNQPIKNMPAKKTTKKVAAKKTAAKAPAAKKTAVKKTAVKAPAARKAPAKTAGKSPAKKSPPSPDAIAKAAYLNYRRRTELGLPGDDDSDWHEAVRSLNND